MNPADGPPTGGTRWRLVVDEAEDGPWNMAVDEAILEAYESAPATPGPTLRLYGWEPATVSLGRTQRAGGALDAMASSREGIGLVRRPTGGVAVLHEFERTYSVVGTLGVPPFTGGVITNYSTIANALTCALSRLGIAAIAVGPRRGARHDAAAVCFERVGAWEIVAHGRKLVGSAQARRRGAFLQHGSIPLRLDPSRMEAVLGLPVDGSRFIDVERATGAAVDAKSLDEALVGGFEEAFGARLLPGKLTEVEALRAAELRCWKYDSIAWTRGGTIGSREARWGPTLSREGSPSVGP